MSENNLAPLEWSTEKRKVLDLVPYEINPRKITAERLEKLKKSLLKFNLAELPAINTDNVIIAGHQRIKVLLELGRGDEFIDVRVPNRPLTDIEFKEYNIGSNISVGYWDIDVLTEAFDDIDLNSLGLDVSDIELPDELIPDQFKTEEEGDVDPTPPAIPITIEGDCFELESIDKKLTHRLICGSSSEEHIHEKVLNGASIDLVVTDPPYNVDYQGKVKTPRKKIENDHMDRDEFYAFLLNYFAIVYENLRPGGGIYVFHADTEGINFRRSFLDAGIKLSQCLIWLKNSFVMGRQDYHWKHEPCLYGWKEGAAHSWYSDRKQSTILEFSRPIASKEPPTMKPIDMLEYLIGNSSAVGDIVFDGFVGSGSTLIASEKTMRNCIAIELSPGYVDVTVKRWLKYMTENNREYKVLRNGKLLNDVDLKSFLE